MWKSHAGKLMLGVVFLQIHVAVQDISFSTTLIHRLYLYGHIPRKLALFLIKLLQNGGSRGHYFDIYPIQAHNMIHPGVGL